MFKINLFHLMVSMWWIVTITVRIQIDLDKRKLLTVLKYLSKKKRIMANSANSQVAEILFQVTILWKVVA